MEQSRSDRRKFIREAAVSAAGMVAFPALSAQQLAAAGRASSGIVDGQYVNTIYTGEPRIKFSVIGINHGHINSQIEVVKRGGGELVSFYAKEPDLAAAFSKTYPQAKAVGSAKEILEDKSIQLVLSAAIPDERAAIGIEVMRHGKDFMADKPGIITLQQLADVRRVQKETKRIYSIMYGERLESPATLKAGKLVKEGAIGKVIQTIGFGPHRMNPKTRPPWFFQRKHYGGIIADLASHQFDQFLFFTGSTKAEIVASQVGNVNHPEYPELEDFGDVMLHGNGGAGYMRVDWFTPDSLKTWGDSRATILGTEGYIEMRKNIDITGREGGNHLFLVNNKETTYMDCSKEPLTYGTQLVDDVINRTETAMSQEHCFLATELALKAQQQARNIKMP